MSTIELAAQMRKLADDVWAEAKQRGRFLRIDAMELKNISTRIHGIASELEKFEEKKIL
jgi:hypothetical protein